MRPPSENETLRAGDNAHLPARAMTHLDLFSGIGGFALAARWTGAIETIGFSEIDPYASAILKKHWPDIPNYGDIRNITPEALANAERERERRNSGALAETESYEESVQQKTGRSSIPAIDSSTSARTELISSRRVYADLVTGGFPCQPFSLAGKRAGAADDRFLWPEMLRVIAESGSAYVVGENVPGIINMELDRCLSDLENIGYTAWPIIIPACAVDARHRRSRVWIVAHRIRAGLEERKKQPAREEREAVERGCNAIPNSQRAGGNGSGYGASENSGRLTQPPALWPNESEWFTQSGMGRVSNGIPNRVHRLKALGNSIVPQVAFQILKAIVEIEIGLTK